MKPAVIADSVDTAVAYERKAAVEHRTVPGSITVIVPTYNCGRFIGEAIESILAQTLAPDEIIVVDDGSIDDTEEVVARFVDPRLRYIRQDNAGVSVARNTGLTAASGEFVAFLDADDRWRPALLERLHELLLREPQLVCAFANFVRFEERAGILERDQFYFYSELRHLPLRPGAVAGTQVIAGDAFASLVTCGEIPAYTQVMMFRRQLIEQVRFNPKLSICQDMEYVLQTFMRGPVAFTDEILAEVRRHETNATRNVNVMALHKLNALRALAPHVTTAQRQAAYHDRLVKAHIDAANSQCQMGQVGAAFRTFVGALRINGSPMRKARGLARIMVNACTAMTRAPDRRFARRRTD